MKLIKFLFLFSIPLLLSTSCKNDDDTVPTPSEEKIFVKEITYNDVPISQYTYNHDGLLVKAVVEGKYINPYFKFFHSDKKLKFIFYYDNNNKLDHSKIFYNDIIQDSLSINTSGNDKIIDKFHMKDGKWEKGKQLHLFYNENQKIRKTVQKNVIDGKLVTVMTDEFEYKDNNLVKEKHTYFNEVGNPMEDKRTYQHIENPNPLFKINHIIGFIVKLPELISEDLISMETIDINGSVITIDYSYKFNDKGYPTDVDVNVSTGEKNSYKFNYYK
ncbi:MAG: hypothetical protein ACEPOW_01890 [Bacteroidales bacterium]